MASLKLKPIDNTLTDLWSDLSVALRAQYLYSLVTDLQLNIHFRSLWEAQLSGLQRDPNNLDYIIYLNLTYDYLVFGFRDSNLLPSADTLRMWSETVAEIDTNQCPGELESQIESFIQNFEDKHAAHKD